MKLSYRLQLFLCVALAFALFTLSVFIFEQSRERKFKTEAIEEKLDAYAEVVSNSIRHVPHENYPDILNTIASWLPENLRLSIIDSEGEVLYDNSVSEWDRLENHLDRPEIVEAEKNNKGTDIRVSESTQQKYLYYVKNEGDIFIRVALSYDIQVQRFFQSDNIFLYVIILLFLTVLFILNKISTNFSKSIVELRNFALDPAGNKQLHFPKNEIGEIGKEIAENYTELRHRKEKIELEQEKLLQHIQNSKEGICFFSSDKKPSYYNGLFLQYIHNITDEPNSDPAVILYDPLFKEIQRFIDSTEDYFTECYLKQQGKVFSVRAVRFDDGSFEVILNDVSKQEKIKQLKQQMVSNIAHELRTPVTGIRGYLETVLDKEVEEETKRHFLIQAFHQTKVLSELIQDMSLINKMDEAGQSLEKTALHLDSLLERLKEDYALLLKDNKIHLKISVPDNTILYAHESLIYSMFKNLMDNAIRYGGGNMDIHISMYKEDAKYCYFLFYDTGIGLADEKHLSRIFERFYRVEEGRTRDSGGSGLGLSIVKNAVSIHGGTIIAKNRREGGLEFLFHLEKYPKK